MMTRKVCSVNKLSLMVSIAAALLPAAAIGQTSNTVAQGQTGKKAAQGQTSKKAAQGQTSKKAAQGQTSKKAAQGQTSKKAAQGQTNNKPAQASTLAEITVTAQRLSTPLEKTPVSVTALSPEVLKVRNVVDVKDLAEQIPGVQLSGGTAPSAKMQVTMRGARTETSGIRANGTVGLYIDNVIQPRIYGSFFDFYDVDQVEVLRGPQGTLYGRNTSGGAIKIRTRLPAYYWTGAMQVSAGNYRSRAGKVYLSGPLIADKLAFSFSGVHREREGFLYGLQRQRRVGNIATGAERIKLFYQPTEKLTFDLAVYGMQDDSEQRTPIPLLVRPDVVDPYAIPGRNLQITEVKQNLGQSIIQRGASLNANWNVTDDLKLSSITGYGRFRQMGSPGNLLTGAEQAAKGGRLDTIRDAKVYTRDKWFTQEFDLTYTTDRIMAVGGLYYFRDQGASYSQTAGRQTDHEKSLVNAPAVFGQITYTIGGGVAAVAGIRYTRETNHYFSHDLTKTIGPQIGDSKSNSITPKLGINWQINPNLFTYVSWTQGTRSGGFNARDLTGKLHPVPYDPEWVDSYELGGKWFSSNHKFRLNTTLYEADYTNQQVVQLIQGPGFSSYFWQNAGGSRVRGLELEATWKVTNSFSLYGIMAFQQGKYTKTFFCGNQFGVQIDCTNKHLKGLPKAKTNLGFSFTPSISLLPGQLAINFNWAHNSKIYNRGSGPLPPPLDYGPTPKLDLFNGSIGWTDDQNQWSVTLDVRNITNKHYVQQAIPRSHPTHPGWVGYVGAPRQVWVRVGYEF